MRINSFKVAALKANQSFLQKESPSSNYVKAARASSSKPGSSLEAFEKEA